MYKLQNKRKLDSSDSTDPGDSPNSYRLEEEEFRFSTCC